MAHNLNLNKRTGEYAFAKVGNPAWHKLGKLIDKPMTSEQTLEYAQLDYLVEKDLCIILILMSMFNLVLVLVLLELILWSN